MNLKIKVNGMAKHCPFITGRLTDRYGNPVNPYIPGAIAFTVLPHVGKAEKNRSTPKTLSIAIEGCAAVYSDEKRISPPIPFCIIQSVCLSAPKGSSLSFQVTNFHCWAEPPCGDASEGTTRLLLSMETAAFSKKDANLLVPQVDSSLNVIDRVCIFTKLICDSVRFGSGCCIEYKSASFHVEISQFNAISDGTKRTYRNSDELKEYGDRGILSPEEVSYSNVFVNGVLQPKSNYVLQKGELTFLTQDIPSKDQPVMILFVKWMDVDGKMLEVTERQYSAVSDGFKKLYTDEDKIKEYGAYGIPSPGEVSYFNLYSNGVLQPTVNYRVKKGVLQLTTTDAPVKGAPVILESISIRDRLGQLFLVESYNYSAHSNGGKIYTNQDEIQMYGTQGISSPKSSLYQNLFINAVIQPGLNYRVQKGCLILDTADDPTAGAPITLQFINGCPSPPPCKTQMSDAALARWEEQYSHIKGP